MCVYVCVIYQSAGQTALHFVFADRFHRRSFGAELLMVATRMEKALGF